MTKVDKWRILRTMSPPLFTQIEEWGDGGMRTRSWLSRPYRNKRMACKYATVWLYVNLKHGLGSAGCSVNWSSYGSASHQVSGLSLKNYLTAWTRHTRGY